MPTFKTEALCFVSNVHLFKRLLLWNEWLTLHYLVLIRQLLTMRFITKAPPISNIDSKCHRKAVGPI